eukprot:s1054_g14.t1
MNLTIIVDVPMCHDIHDVRRSGEAATKMHLSAVCAQGTQLFQLLRSVYLSSWRSPVPLQMESMNDLNDA